MTRLAQRGVSLRRANSVAFGAKRTLPRALSAVDPMRLTRTVRTNYRQNAEVRLSSLQYARWQKSFRRAVD
jgi:hypothetical protein